MQRLTEIHGAVAQPQTLPCLPLAVPVWIYSSKRNDSVGCDNIGWYMNINSTIND